MIYLIEKDLYIIKEINLGFWRNGTLIGSPKIEKGNLEIFNNIECNNVLERANISPNSLSHLKACDSSISQYIPIIEYYFFHNLFFIK